MSNTAPLRQEDSILVKLELQSSPKTISSEEPTKLTEWRPSASSISMPCGLDIHMGALACLAAQCTGIKGRQGHFGEQIRVAINANSLGE